MSENTIYAASHKKVVMPIRTASVKACVLDRSKRNKTLVLALGNPLRGDDGIGVAILEHIDANASLPSNVTLCDGGCAGLESVLLLQGYNRAIIVDAAKIGGKPGAWRRWRFGQAMLRQCDMHTIPSLHFAGLAEALTLGDALGILPPEIVIYGVQPRKIGWSPGLSEPVRHAIPAICANILEEL